MNRRHCRCRFTAAVLSAWLGAAGTASACTIYVSHNDDAAPPFWSFGAGSDDKMLFREAVEIGKGDARCFTGFEMGRIEGANFIHDPVFCGTIDNTRNWRLDPLNPGCGPNNADTIKFWDNINGGAQITLASYVRVDPLDSIDGGTFVPGSGARQNISLQGSAGCSVARGGLVVGDALVAGDASGSISNLYISGFCGVALWAPRVNGLKVVDVVISAVSLDSSGNGAGLALGQITGSPDQNDKCIFGAQVGGTGAGQANYFFNIAGDAISLRDTCTGNLGNRNNKIFNNYVGVCEALDTGEALAACADGTPNQGIGGNGILLQDANGTAVGGAGAGQGNFLARAVTAGIQITGNNAINNTVRGNKIGVAPVGDFARPNNTGVLISAGADNNTVGGTNAGEGNTISSNNLRGVTIDGVGTSDNRVSGNVIGLDTSRTLARPNADGIGITNGADAAQIDNNVIAANSLWGIYINGGSGHQVHDNTIGLRGAANNANDNTAAPNLNGGIWINDVGSNTIGPGNRISGNGSDMNGGPGVQVTGEGANANVIKGNTIGLDNGGGANGNHGGGILVFAGADVTVIGGTIASDRNVISGNGGSGVLISGNMTDGNVIRFNYIGTDAAGNVAHGNAGEGIRVEQGATNTSIKQNLIGGNGNDGIKLQSGATGSYVILNTIGLSNALTAIPDLYSGISLLSGASNNTIGDANPQVSAMNIVVGHAGGGSAGIFVADPGTANNTIAGNLVGGFGFPNNYGIYVTNGATGNQMRTNGISGNLKSGVAIVGNGTIGNPIIDNEFLDNGGLGIDLGADGVTANDFKDGDTGPDNLLNHPVLRNAVIGVNSVTLTAQLNSTPFGNFGITIYRSDRCDPSGYGEGQAVLDKIIVGADANGDAGMSGLTYSVPNSQTVPSWATAIALTPAGDTSEFSACIGISDEIFRGNFE